MQYLSPPVIARRKLQALLLALLPLVSACSGGGQSAAPGLPSTTLSNSNPPPAPVNYNTAEYRRNWGLDGVSAISAYNAGFTGKGITVGIVDTGIDVNNTELSPNIAPASTNIVTNNRADLQDTDGHGTAVAGLVAAVRNGIGTEGIAFDATLLAINATSSCGVNCSFFQSDIAAGIDYARLHGARVVNLSMGGVGVGVTLEGAMRRAVSAGMIIVIAASNDAAANPSDFAQVAEAGWANGQILIAGASNQLNELASFSNKAGDLAKNFYLVAPGDHITTTNLGGGLAIGSGTSFSTPMVVGAAAILMQEFPNLTGQQVANILLTTATDLGAPGVDNVYGYGLLNLARAIAPIGVTSIPTGGGTSLSPTGSGGLVSTSAIHISGAFGDALSRSTALTSAMIIDSYQRSYRMDLTSRIQHDQTLPDLYSLIEPGQKTISRDIHPAKGLELRLTADQNTAFKEIDAQYFSNNAPDRQHRPDLRWQLSQNLGNSLSLEAGSHMALYNSLAPDNAGLFLSRPESKNIATGKSDDLSMALTSRLTADTSFSITGAYTRLHDRLYQLDARQSSTAARLTHSLGRNLSLSLDLGVVNETGSVLGAMSNGAMALGNGAVTTYAGLGLNWHPTPNMQFFSEWMRGRTKVEAADNSLFKNVSNLYIQSFRAGMAASNLWHKSDRLGFMVSEPLRVTGGQAQLMLATSRDYTNNSLTFEALDTKLTPSGHELDLEASYQLPISGALWMQAMILHQINAGHVSDGASQTLALMRFSTGF